ncbi:Fe-S cluster assembly protein SufD, partial [candidate division KSB1 bacterium]|nr:Fe-S cluster assembly protein SufD [candidate division KSB1 bacterium]
MRSDAWRKYESLPLPGQRDEEWMRTDIRSFHLDTFGPPGEGTAETALPSGLLTRGVELGGTCTSLDSRPHAATLRDKWASQGVLFGSLDELFREHQELVR